jgi:3-oxo-5alpha-steroid 4-dehydrogenase
MILGPHDKYIPVNPWKNDGSAAVPAAGQPINQWGLSIDAPLTIADGDAHRWDEQADLVVVGLGGAGVSAALDALERGLSVTALDLYEGGGSSAANGGVYYAGGGTSIQQEAGVIDTPQQMEDYLRFEVGDVVSADTLRDFCTQSRENFEWLRQHGAPFSATLYDKKTSYPPLDKFLYHPDSSLAGPFRDCTPPAARGHRTVHRNGKNPFGLGVGIFAPLKAAAMARGMVFHDYAEVRQLVQDASGRIIGVRIEKLVDPEIRAKHQKLIAKASKWMGMLPSTLPGAQITVGIGYRYMKKALELAAVSRTSYWIGAKNGVVLSAGGFICNPEMVQHFASDYAAGLPNGTLGDNGSGIMLGVSVGGKTGLMNRVSAWRFLSPPKAWGQAMVVDGQGERYVNESWYGARIGDEMVERHQGRAYVIMDHRLWKQSLKDAFGEGVLSFQRDITLINGLFGAVKGKSSEALADKLGFDLGVFNASLSAYNQAAHGRTPDAFHKSPDEMAPLETGPFYAVDASVDARLFPLSCMTVGGLVVDEKTGNVLSTTGTPIEGLYAAGRNAVGLCSNLYVSGLSYSDCIYSGRRAAKAIAKM